MRQLWSIVLCTVSMTLCVPVWGYDRFDQQGVVEYGSVVHSCELSQQHGCVQASLDATVKSEVVLDLVWKMLQEGSALQKDSLLGQMQAVLPFLEVQSQDNSSLQKRFIASLLGLGFTDMIEELEKREKSLYVSSDVLTHGVSKTVIGTYIYDEVRQSLVKQLMQQGFDGFISTPYAYGLGILTTDSTDRTQRTIQQNISSTDQLDQAIQEFLVNENNQGKDLSIAPEVYENREGIYLFKKASDLLALQYGVVSHRSRTNTDAEYRRYNIAKAFEEIGHIRVLNPGQTISYLEDSSFDMQEQQLYRNGKAIFLDEEIDAYGGGLCGGSTALYQGTFLNQSLAFTKRNHSKWYTSLYTAIINGEEQSTPGIDSTIYSPSLDLKITNTAPYPILLVMNYDGTYEGKEEVFTMSPNRGDQGTYQFVQSWPKSYSLAQKEGESRVVQGRCYEREINGELSTRCYKEVF